MITRLEPIIFVIIGYYFGVCRRSKMRKRSKNEIGRQTQKADAAQHAKEQAQQSREVMEENVKNVAAALTSVGPPTLPRGLLKTFTKEADQSTKTACATRWELRCAF